MRTRKLHSGIYHCPQCMYEVDLQNEASLRCDDCGGRLFGGHFPDDYERDDEDDD